MLCGVLSGSCLASDESPENWSAHFQSTYIWQNKPSFRSPYSGSSSLAGEKETAYTFSATAFLGMRPWTGAEFYVNPEVARGHPMSGVVGLGGITNGEAQKGGSPKFRTYRARAFLRQTWDEGEEREAVESGPNQLAGSVAKQRWVVTAGNLAASDLFDANAYSHDPRTQFLNWSLMSHGAYDVAADARGYSWGLALEWFHDDWALRAGRFAEPKQPNQQALDTQLGIHFGDQIEIEHGHEWAGQRGKLRVLLFRDRARMARYQDALDQAQTNGGTPDLNTVRTGDHSKYGAGLSLEQSMSSTVAAFARWSWADGRSETYSFAEIDRSLSAGILAQGGTWGRPTDKIGVAFVRNELSAVHRAYLTAGGYGFFVGDGRLNYRPEAIFESFYSLNVGRATALTLDWQYIANPAYNADRGPVRVTSLRLHADF